MERRKSADVLLNMMMLDFSLNEQLKYQEICTYKSFCDFVQMLECKGMYNLLLLLILIKQLFCNNYGFHKVTSLFECVTMSKSQVYNNTKIGGQFKLQNCQGGLYVKKLLKKKPSSAMHIDNAPIS